MILIPKVVLLLSYITFANAFNLNAKGISCKLSPMCSIKNPSTTFDPFEFGTITVDNQMKNAGLMFGTALASFLASPDAAFAKDGSYGILEGRSASMLHPITMFALFFTTLYSGYLGLKWRQLRDLGEEIKVMTQTLPKLSSGAASFPISAAIQKIDSEILKLNKETDGVQIASLTKDKNILSGSLSLDTKYEELTSTRKKLISGNESRGYACDAVNMKMN
jgi:hypothetical protein